MNNKHPKQGFLSDKKETVLAGSASNNALSRQHPPTNTRSKQSSTWNTAHPHLSDFSRR